MNFKKSRSKVDYDTRLFCKTEQGAHFYTQLTATPFNHKTPVAFSWFWWSRSHSCCQDFHLYANIVIGWSKVDTQSEVIRFRRDLTHRFATYGTPKRRLARKATKERCCDEAKIELRLEMKTYIKQTGGACSCKRPSHHLSIFSKKDVDIFLEYSSHFLMQSGWKWLGTRKKLG